MNERSGATTTTFGDLLKRLRKRAGMTQEDLAAAIGYSRSLIAALERNQRLPDVEVVIETYLPALGCRRSRAWLPNWSNWLPWHAANARRLPLLQRERHPVITQQGKKRRMFSRPTHRDTGPRPGDRHLCDRLLGHHGRLLTLVGPPGVGKTRLAQALGAEVHVLPGWRLFRPLAPVTDPALVASTLLSALKVHDGSASRRARLIEHLRRKEMLLVLDNFEQLLSASSPAVALVAELLAECPDLHILVTSRERLHLRAEQRYRVQPLALAAAVDLFVQRCKAVDAEFALGQRFAPRWKRSASSWTVCRWRLSCVRRRSISSRRPNSWRDCGIAGSSCWWTVRRICRRASARCATPLGIVTSCWMRGSAASFAAWASSWVGVTWRRSKPLAHGIRKWPAGRCYH